MFNCLGTIVKRKVVAATAPDTYYVSSPVICSEDIEAQVLTVPGVFTKYQAGDVVIVAEIENTEVEYFILGKLQLYAQPAAEIDYQFSAQIETIKATNGVLNEGVQLKGRNAIMSIDYLLNYIQELRDEVISLRSSLSSVNSLIAASSTTNNS